MFLSVLHNTRFQYSSPITESLVEVRAYPRTDGGQRCHAFSLTTIPRATVLDYVDSSGNRVHHFDIPGAHTQLAINVRMTVETSAPVVVPDALDADAWAALDPLERDPDLLAHLLPGYFTAPTPLLRAFADSVALRADADPLTALVRLNTLIGTEFAYMPQSTRVDSPIDEALAARRGVCQDFSHIMLAVARSAGIPCRYVSGYLYHESTTTDRSAADATHAWVEAYLPGLGWVGFDPTNRILAGERHIRSSVGRDYADVPPNRGVFKGQAISELEVGVRVALAQAPEIEPPTNPIRTVWEPPARQSSYAEQQ